MKCRFYRERRFEFRNQCKRNTVFAYVQFEFPGWYRKLDKGKTSQALYFAVYEPPNVMLTLAGCELLLINFLLLVPGIQKLKQGL